MTTTGSRPDVLRLVPALRDVERSTLLDIAESAIARALRTGRRVLPDDASLPERLREIGASFVTLRRQGRLLGCIGTLEPYQAIGVDVAEHALAAAFADPRFPPIDVEDYERMSIDVSVLGPHQPLEVPDLAALRRSLRSGVDGLVVSSPGHRATFLPAVWSGVRDADDFCALLWRKAGLVPGEWPSGIRLATYEVDAFERSGPRQLVG